MYKKAQAALEFMMTYGWAILVVLAAIGALSYFGILNPARFTPDTCLASSGFACPGKPLVTDTSVTFSLVNGQGYPVTLTEAGVEVNNMNCANPTGTGVELCDAGFLSGGTCTTPKVIQDGAAISVTFDECVFADVQVVKGEAKFAYVNTQSGLTEQLIVSITGKPK